LGHVHHDDGDDTRGILRCHARRCRHRGDHVDLQPDQLRRECGKSIELALGVTGLDRNVLPLDPACLAEPFLEGVEEVRDRHSRTAREIAHSADFAGRLGLGGERRGEEAASDHAKEGASLHHSIT
jgi:hypothetical protein